MLTKVAKRRASWLYTNRLRVPSDGEVKLATNTIGGWRCEGDGGYVNVREHMMMMVVVMIVQVMMVVLIVMPGHGMRFGYVKTKKRPQSATRSTNGNIVADGSGGGRQIRQCGASLQIVVAVRQEGIRHTGDSSEQTRSQTRADSRVRYAGLPDWVHAGAGQDILKGRRPLAGLRHRVLQSRLVQVGARHRQR